MRFMVLWIIGGFFLLVFVYHMARVWRWSGKTRSGLKALRRKDLGNAERYLGAALRIAKRMQKGYFDCEAVAWLNLSLLAAARKDTEEAARCAGRAIRALDGLKDQDKHFHLMFGQAAELLEANGEFADAVQFRQYALSAVTASHGKESFQAAIAMVFLAN